MPRIRKQTGVLKQRRTDVRTDRPSYVEVPFSPQKQNRCRAQITFKCDTFRSFSTRARFFWKMIARRIASSSSSSKSACASALLLMFLANSGKKRSLMAVFVLSMQTMPEIHDFSLHCKHGQYERVDDAVILLVHYEHVLIDINSIHYSSFFSSCFLLPSSL